MTKFFCVLINRLDSCHNTFVIGLPAFQAGGEDPHVSILINCFYFISRLFEQLFDVRYNHHTTVPFLDRVAHDRCQNRCFPASGRDHHTRVCILSPEVGIYRFDRCFLIRSQLHSQPLNSMPASSNSEATSALSSRRRSQESFSWRLTVSSEYPLLQRKHIIRIWSSWIWER